MVRWLAIVGLLVFLLFGNYSFQDINEALNHYGGLFSETRPILGTSIFLGLGLILFFTDEFIVLFRRGKKIKLKKDF